MHNWTEIVQTPGRGTSASSPVLFPYYHQHFRLHKCTQFPSIISVKYDLQTNAPTRPVCLFFDLRCDVPTHTHTHSTNKKSGPSFTKSVPEDFLFQHQTRGGQLFRLRGHTILHKLPRPNFNYYQHEFQG